MVNSHIVLLGYMGCGKTTISNKLEAILNLPKFDLDQIIEKEYKMSISSRSYMFSVIAGTCNFSC